MCSVSRFQSKTAFGKNTTFLQTCSQNMLSLLLPLIAKLIGLGLSGRLHTACSERVNLTVRHGVAALARRTWATTQQSPQLLAHRRTSSHFVCPHASLWIAFVHPR